MTALKSNNILPFQEKTVELCTLITLGHKIELKEQDCFS